MWVPLRLCVHPLFLLGPVCLHMRGFVGTGKLAKYDLWVPFSHSLLHVCFSRVLMQAGVVSGASRHSALGGHVSTGYGGPAGAGHALGAAGSYYPSRPAGDRGMMPEGGRGASFARRTPGY